MQGDHYIGNKFKLSSKNVINVRKLLQFYEYVHLVTLPINFINTAY